MKAFVLIGTRLAADFLMGVHATPALDYLHKVAACPSMIDALQAIHSVDLHVVASAAIWFEMGLSVYHNLTRKVRLKSDDEQQ